MCSPPCRSPKTRLRSVSAELYVKSPAMSRQTASTMCVRITVAGKSFAATLANSEAARDFASLLPLTLTMNDLFRREKFAPLPRAISEEGAQTHAYAVGTIGYWAPGP